MIPIHDPRRLNPGKRVLVSAPRPDSFMLRMRSLREAGRLSPAPAPKTWPRTDWLDVAPGLPVREGLA